MLAVFQTGGKQYKVAKGDEIHVERLPGNVGDAVRFDKILMMGSENAMQVGNPLLEGAEVIGEVLRQARAKKVLVFKFKRRKKYRKKQGHRQYYTRLKITDIGSSSEEAPAAKTEEAVPVASE